MTKIQADLMLALAAYEVKKNSNHRLVRWWWKRKLIKATDAAEAERRSK